MGQLGTAAVAGAIAFAVTNIDGLIVLMLLFARVDAKLRRHHVVVGQYVGFAAIVLASLPAALCGLIVPTHWLGLLGLLPIAIGVGRLMLLVCHRSRAPASGAQLLVPAEAPMSLHSVLGAQTAMVASVTFANGGDNVAIYAPLFVGRNFAATGVILVVFFVMIGAWCWLGHRLASHTALARTLTRYSDVAVPVVLILLGLFRLLDSGTFRWLVMR